MSSLSEQTIRETLVALVPEQAITAISLRGDKLGCVISTDAQGPQAQQLQRRCEQALLALEGVEEVTLVLTRHDETPAATTATPRTKAQWRSESLPHVKRIIAIASGKGGVGKSTTTVLLAHALQQAGKRVGILDADIFGPSIPRMMGLQQAGQPAFEAGQIIPHQAYGMNVMSMGFLTGDNAAVMRGAMVSKVLAQMLRQVRWATAEAPLDVLLIDMPPGTGDIHISMVQQVPLDGALIVTTPQEVSRIDADKCAQMFTKVSVPIIGVIENMSYFTDPTGMQHSLFGQGAGQALADAHAVPLLAQLALEPTIGAALDQGQKPVLPDALCQLAAKGMII